ncbi:MAG: sulfide/dihydroorotate dehydrogenase-like FAD/NAD-binding protein [Candidatus Aminicenantes bacterium]|nr:sulfide/dihydroorotate dehydrogenase-like FAD/NAD-binding protein [Candidatus Aminicenantes bacterium]
MAHILERRRLVPNIHLIRIHAPEVARRCRPGQFIMVMADPDGERIPLSIADWDAAEGSVSAVFLLVGTSTQKLARLKAGDALAACAGPLGRPSEIAAFGTVLLVAGCYGIGALYPAARALRAAGNRLLLLADVKAGHLFYWQERFRELCDRVMTAERDLGGMSQEFASRTVAGVAAGEKRIDRVMVSGCAYLLASVSEATRPLGLRTIVSLNPVMVDGTGMCGACRCSIGGKTRFACVDGPDFDGHQVDWPELFRRRAAYLDDEIRSLCWWERETLP